MSVGIQNGCSCIKLPGGQIYDANYTGGDLTQTISMERYLISSLYLMLKNYFVVSVNMHSYSCLLEEAQHCSHA